MKRLSILIGVILTIILFVIKPEDFYFLHLANYFNVSIFSLNIINQTISWIEFIIVFFYSIRIEKQHFLLWIESNLSIKIYFSSVLLILFLTFFGGTLIYYLSYHTKWYNIYEKIHFVDLTAIPIKLLYVTTAAVVEEFIFRGYLMPRLQFFFKTNYLTISFSAILFALAHIMFGSFANTIFPLLGGFIYGYFYWKYRNIKILIICHFITDLTFMTFLN